MVNRIFIDKKRPIGLAYLIALATALAGIAYAADVASASVLAVVFASFMIGVLCTHFILPTSRRNDDFNEERADTVWQATEAKAASAGSKQAHARFLATVSHEIRTPLNGIIGMSDLLSATSLSGEQHAYNEAVRKSGTVLLSLINDILDFSKIEAGHLNLVATKTEIEPLVENVVELLAPRAFEKSLGIACYCSANVPDCLTLDGARLRQVLFNLVGNAIKFTQTGAVAVEVSMDLKALVIKVRDTGIGISDEAKARIFREFSQAEEGTDRTFGGTGLGLAIAERIIVAMGGHLSVESAPGEGALFTVKIPDVATDLPTHSGIQLSPAPSKPCLIAMAPSLERDCLVKKAADCGMAAIVAPTLRDALAKCTAAQMAGEAPISLFVDMQLVKSTEAMMEDVKDAIGELLHIVALTTPAYGGDIDALKRVGLSGHLSRPIRSASFRAAADWMADVLMREKSHFFKDPAVAKEEIPPSRRNLQDGLKVLFVEDNPINALLSRAMLERENCEVVAVATGQEAIDAFQSSEKEPFDLVLMDLHMPGMDGAETTRILRALEHARTGHAPPTRIIMLTADGTTEAHAQAIGAGVDAVLTKPMDIDALREVLDDINEDFGEASFQRLVS